MGRVCVVCILFFFFQAEDGIRDYKVTGVQTCALPISAARALAGPRAPVRRQLEQLRGAGRNDRDQALRAIDAPRPGRSEEHTSELQSPCNLVCRLLLEKKNTKARSPRLR